METLKKVAKSLLVVCGIASILAAVLYDKHTLQSYLQWFIAGVIFQFAMHYSITYVTDLLLLEKIRRQELEFLKIEKTNQYNVQCPCERRMQQLIPINIGDSNNYTCDTCNKQVSVIIDVTTALKTTPITLVNIADIADIAKPVGEKV